MTVQVQLTPADAVDLGDGSIRLLRDCTLAELTTYADTLEAQLSESLASVRLAELAEQADVEIVIQLLDENKESDPAQMTREVNAADMLEQAILTKPKSPTIGEVGASSTRSDLREDAEADQTETETETEAEVDPEAAIGDQQADIGRTTADASEEPLIAPLPADEVKDSSQTDGSETEGRADRRPPLQAAEESSPLPPAQSIGDRRRILGRRRPLNHPTWTVVDILMNESAFRDAQAHALSSMDREVAGMLIGPPAEKQPDGRYLVHVTDIIIAKHTRMQGASVTYTPESWRYVHDRLAELYPEEDAVILGWYHTHPGFGIFLSGMDQFIHQHFFTQPWHVALVLDPLSKRSGFFCWDREQLRVDAYEFPWPNWALRSW
ncbi:MAG: hypothetical protein R3300_12845 [Candidatus Promineifilaceae bacterium]|nr:hypothetical protein [Candidatus Promineifilaceae bacterium]